MKLTEACIRNPVFAWMLMAATLVFGAVALSRIGISQYPDVDTPVISISVVWEGAAPEVIEHSVLQVMEEALVQVEGLRSISSAAFEGSAWITVELDLNRNVDAALQDIQTRLSKAQSHLPPDMYPPVVWKSNPEDQPILWVSLSGPFAPQLLADVARYQIREKLQTISGVGEITLGGHLERNVRIWVNADRLSEHGITVTEIVEALRREHVELPAGRLETQGREVTLRMMGEAFDLQTLQRIVVRSQPEGNIYLEDLALVEDGFEDVRKTARTNGLPSQGLGIRKQRGSNAVAVAHSVRQMVETLRPTLPQGMDLDVIFDGTRFVKESMHEIEFEILLSVVLTALVCWMFLGSLSSTLNVVLAIPMSLCGTAAVLYFCGYTLNTFTLLALGLAVGLVVDDAIMVLENIFRHAEMGKDKRQAALEGTGEITFAAMAATLAVVAIFIPVVFMKGVIGRFFLQFGIALSVAVLLSYLEAVTLTPARCAQFLHVNRDKRSRLGHAVDSAFDALSRFYSKILNHSLRRPGLVLWGAVLVCVASVFILCSLPREFVPSQDQSSLLVRLKTAVGSSLEETDRLVRRAEAFMATRPEIKQTFTMVGGGHSGAVNSAHMFLTLVPPNQRTLSQQQVSAVLRQELNTYPGLRANVQDLSQAGFSSHRGYPIEFSLRGADWDKLVDIYKDIKAKLTQSGYVTDMDTNYQVGRPELRISPERARAADAGVSIDAIASTVNALMGGIRVGKYNTGGRRIDVRLRLMADQRTRPEDLGRFCVRNPEGALIPLSMLISQKSQPALQSITRRDRQRAITVYANVAKGHAQSEVIAYIQRLNQDLPLGYHAVLDGASVTYQESMGGLVFALLLGLLMSYMVLASQFNSFIHPITVLTILPLSIAGAAFALMVAGKSLNIFTMIGLLLLLGIVKKNAIILVDYAVQLQAQGIDACSAMQQAGPVRLRPILMTSIATLMAVLPAALNLGPGAETRGPMAIAVIGGLVVSTLLSLWVVPAFYVLADAGKNYLRKRRTTASLTPVQRVVR